MPSVLFKSGGRVRVRLLCHTGLCVQVWRLWWEDGSGRKGGGHKTLPPTHQGYPSSSRLRATRCKQQIKTRLPQGREEGHQVKRIGAERRQIAAKALFFLSLGLFRCPSSPWPSFNVSLQFSPPSFIVWGLQVAYNCKYVTQKNTSMTSICGCQSDPLHKITRGVKETRSREQRWVK